MWGLGEGVRGEEMSTFCPIVLTPLLGRRRNISELLLQEVTDSVCFVTPHQDRLIGMVVRRPPRERKIPGSNPACARIFLGLSHTNDLKIGTPVATLPGIWRYRVSTGTGRPSVSIL